MKAKTRHFPITDFGGRGGLNFPLNLSKIVAEGQGVQLKKYSKEKLMWSLSGVLDRYFELYRTDSLVFMIQKTKGEQY